MGIGGGEGLISSSCYREDSNSKGTPGRPSLEEEEPRDASVDHWHAVAHVLGLPSRPTEHRLNVDQAEDDPGAE